jgi:hypothetical protein
MPITHIKTFTLFKSDLWENIYYLNTIFLLPLHLAEPVITVADIAAIEQLRTIGRTYCLRHSLILFIMNIFNQ